MLNHLLAQMTLPTFTADEVLSPYVFVFYLAFLVSVIFTPVMRRVATYFNIIDEPDLVRKLHSRPVAYLGGVAVFLGWMAGLTMSQFLFMHRAAPGLPPHPVINFSIVAGACVIVVLGLLDDIYKASPRIKIGGQILAAVILLYDGVGTHWTRVLLSPFSVRMTNWFGWPPAFVFPDWLIITTSCIGTIAIVVFCCNATNLMDGLDGLCGGVTAIVALGFVILAVHLGMMGGGASTNWDAVRVVLGLALLGGVLGFVPYNFNPASIFMGDTGSMFLGFACAVMIVLLADAGSKWFLAAGVMFALPVLDTTLAFARRWVNRRPLFSPDKFHFHHQLVARGLTVKRAVMVAYLLAICFVVLGTGIVLTRTRYVVGVYFVVFAYIIVAAYKIGMVHERPSVISGGKPLGREDLITSSPRIDAGSVLEIREDEKKTL
jgi:UDP-GlcNAc:undecaprenyl-phosphate/decaprenyl-phosphate GlcNAc-1-phosphate transferase